MLYEDSPRMRSPSDFSLVDESCEVSSSPSNSGSSLYLCCPRPSLELTLADRAGSPFTLQEFKAFVRNNHCSEPLEFYYDIVKYSEEALKSQDTQKQMSHQDQDDFDMHLRDAWERIMLVYIHSSAPKELNITSESRTAILDLQHASSYPPKSPTVLERLLEFALSTLRESSYSQFVNEQQLGLVLDMKYAHRVPVTGPSPPGSRNSSIPNSDNDESHYTDNTSPINIPYAKPHGSVGGTKGTSVGGGRDSVSKSHKWYNGTGSSLNQTSPISQSYSDEDVNTSPENSFTSPVESSSHSSTRRFSFLRSLRASNSPNGAASLDSKRSNPRTLPGSTELTSRLEEDNENAIYEGDHPVTVSKSNSNSNSNFNANWRGVSRKLKLKLH